MVIIIKSFSRKDQREAKVDFLSILSSFVPVKSKDSNREEYRYDYILDYEPRNLSNLIVKEFHFGPRKTKFTLIRSPHVHKKSREQFEKRVFKSVYQLSPFVFTCQKEYDFFLLLLKNHIFSGVNVELKISFSGYFRPTDQGDDSVN